MSGGQIDKLCRDWLRENYGEEVASEYSSHSLVMSMWNSPELNQGLETLRWALSTSFGPDQSFRTTDYHEARSKLGVPEDRIPVPEVFIKAFVGAGE